jgi:hypothetical protein
MVELQSFSGTAPDTLTFVPSPHEQPHVLGNRFTSPSLKTFGILQSLHFTSHLLDVPLTA